MNKIFFYLIFTCCITTFFSCEKELSEEHAATLQSEGSLWDSTGNCLPYSVYGTVYGGVTPGADTAYVEIQVNVTATGAYKIESDLQDGYLYSDSGFFSNTGLNVVHLKPIGTPIIPGTFTFNINFDSTFCSFTVNVQDSTGTGLGGTQDTTGTGGGDTTGVQNGGWKYSQGSSVYSGLFDSASKDNSTGLITFVYLNGVSSTGDTAMNLQFSILASDINPGTYTMLQNTIMFSSGDVLNDFSYAADAFLTGTDLTVVVTSYDASTKEMKGTFSGSAQNKSGSIVPITNGSFDVVVQ